MHALEVYVRFRYPSNVPVMGHAQSAEDFLGTRSLCLKTLKARLKGEGLRVHHNTVAIGVGHVVVGFQTLSCRDNEDALGNTHIASNTVCYPAELFFAELFSLDTLGAICADHIPPTTRRYSLCHYHTTNVYVGRQLSTPGVSPCLYVLPPA